MKTLQISLISLIENLLRAMSLMDIAKYLLLKKIMFTPLR